jgi:methyl-accepting chemotaxis protein
MSARSFCGRWSTQGKIEAVRAAQETQRNDIEHLNGNLQMVATATHEIESSIAEIASNAVDVSQAAEEQHLATQEMAQNLERAAHRTSEIANMRLDENV